MNLAQVTITAKLQSRPARPVDFAQENLILQRLTTAFLNGSEHFLERVVAEVHSLVGADSTGLTLVSPSESKTDLRWIGLSSSDSPLSPHEAGVTPCLVCRKSGQPQLFSEPLRFFSCLKSEPPIQELLIAPILTDGRAMGSFWLISTSGRQFDLGDLRKLQIFADLAGAALKTKLIETRLRQTEAFSSTILESSPDCVKVLDSEGRLIFMNQAGCRLLGIQCIQDFLGKRWVDFWSPPEKKKAAYALKTAATGEPSSFEGFRPTLQGQEKWWNAIVTMLPSEPSRFLIVSRDITREKENEAALRTLNEELEERVIKRTADLNLAHQRLVVLARKLVKSGEDERQHLAKELHDEMGQHLTALRLTIENLEAEFPGQAKSQINRVRELLQTVMRQVRDVSFDLRQSLPEHITLTAALHGHFAQMRALHGLKVKFKPEPIGLQAVPPEISRTVLRLVQESLTNVIKHANVRTALVRLAVNGNILSLDVIDKGLGFRASARKKARLGLIGMEERVLLLGGKLLVTSKPGAGTRLQAFLPLNIQDL